MKAKYCAACKQDHTTMYRMQKEKGKEWIFVCKNCLPDYQRIPHYRYGGTWKGYRH